MAFLQCEFHSDVLGRACSMNVLVPQKAATQIGMVSSGETGRAEYPVLYLLHGLSDNHTIWMRRTSIERYAAAYGIVVVMPAGERGFYTDMAEGYRYWTMVSEELPQIVRNLFPVSAKREDTFAAGLSMGGYGALKLALRCPERFAGAVALSPVTDPRGWFIGGERPEMREELTRIFGSAERIVANGDDLFALADALLKSSKPKPRILQVCGTEDGLLRENHRFRDYMEKVHFPGYCYIEDAGTHNWEFWDHYIQDGLRFLFGTEK
ncbi:alpha/beta hydrolase family protein [uncultured Victivallis sp.]|uniref:alpha/beta hydrolase n=1 Tax=uncultured Victivallis sp. TaxID=354118 RepID=UPI0025CCEAEB|nr:alpha/beta hydrolase family protein [uncultured Victivallis sp.]